MSLEMKGLNMSDLKESIDRATVCRAIFDGDLPFSDRAFEMTTECIDTALELAFEYGEQTALDMAYERADGLVPVYTQELAQIYAETCLALDYDADFDDADSMVRCIQFTLCRAYAQGIEAACELLIELAEEAGAEEEE